MAFEAFLKTPEGINNSLKFPNLESVSIESVSNLAKTSNDYKELVNITYIMDSFQEYLAANEDEDEVDVIQLNEEEKSEIPRIYKNATEKIKEIIKENKRRLTNVGGRQGGRKSKTNKRRITRRKRSIKNKRSMNKNRQIR